MNLLEESQMEKRITPLEMPADVAYQIVETELLRCRVAISNCNEELISAEHREERERLYRERDYNHARADGLSFALYYMARATGKDNEFIALEDVLTNRQMPTEKRQ
jgi:hypothetical protein